MKLRPQRLLRAFSLWLYDETATWVVPDYIHDMADQGRFREAKACLELQREAWPNDPELVRVWANIDFLEYDLLEGYNDPRGEF